MKKILYQKGDVEIFVEYGDVTLFTNYLMVVKRDTLENRKIMFDIAEV